MKASIGLISFTRQIVNILEAHQTKWVNHSIVRLLPVIGNYGKLDKEPWKGLHNCQNLNKSKHDKKQFVLVDDNLVPEKHDNDQQHDDKKLRDWHHDESVKQVQAVGNRKAYHVLSTKVWMMQLDISLIIL